MKLPTTIDEAIRMYGIDEVMRHLRRAIETKSLERQCHACGFKKADVEDIPDVYNNGDPAKLCGACFARIEGAGWNNLNVRRDLPFGVDEED